MLSGRKFIFRTGSCRALSRDEEGGLTIFGLYVIAAMAIIGGIAVDYQSLLAARTKLQLAADTVAHAALYNRETMPPDDAKSAAVALVERIQPMQGYGEVLKTSDITFGRYDYTDGKFYADPMSNEAVLVTAARLRERENPVSSILTQFIGLSQFDVRVNAVYATYRPTCLREGFVGEDVVDIQSNNAFYNGFCIHSNTHVKVSTSNFFEAGSVVSMPDTTLLELPQSGFESNDGLREALRNGRYHIRILNRLAREVDRVMTYDSETMPDYITDPMPVTHSTKNVNGSELVQNKYNVINCPNTNLTITGDVPIRNMVIYTSCETTFSNGTILEDVVFISTATTAGAVKGSHVQIGRNDSCATGGGAQILTYGGFSVASDLKVFGGQVIAAGSIEFAANADGIEGASMISGSTISGTSNMTMGFCGSGMEDNFEADYFRLAL